MVSSMIAIGVLIANAIGKYDSHPVMEIAPLRYVSLAWANL